MFCKYCGRVMSDESRFCPECGAPIEALATEIAPSMVVPAEYKPEEHVEKVVKIEPPVEKPQPTRQTYVTPQSQYRAPTPVVVQKARDESNFGYAFLCFIEPIVGLILYLVWKDEYPLRAKSCGKGALVGVIVAVSLTILLVIVYFLFIFSIINSSMYMYMLF